MLTLSRTKPKSESDPQGQVSEPREKRSERTANVGHGWTNGERLKSIGATALLWVCVASGPAALVFGLGEDQPSPAPVADAGQEVAPSQRVSEYAAAFMTRYLETPRGQEERVTEMLARGVKATLTLPESPAAVTAVTPAEAVQLGKDRWVVTVSVQQPGAQDAAPSRTYWQVLVLAQGNAMAVGALPSMVAAPTAGEVSIEPGDELVAGPITKTIDAFIAAYLAGRGEVAPITSPGVAIAPVSPAPFSEVAVTSVRGAREQPEQPAEGDVQRVQVSVSATAADGSKKQLGYTVELRYRDRWEISAVNPTTEGEQSS